MTWQWVRPGDVAAPACRCGCPGARHVHYRPGSDCGSCGNRVCEVYRPHDRGPWTEPPLTPIESVWLIEGWCAYGSPLPDVRPT